LLIDALWYTSTSYKPHTLVDVATLTGSVTIANFSCFSCAPV
jgi:aminopeptidase